MARWSIRDRWGKLTEKKELRPEVRNMLLRLDSVDEPRSGIEQPARAESHEADEDRRPGT